MIFTNNTPIIIGIDHGYGNIKTAHCCFKTELAVQRKQSRKMMNFCQDQKVHCFSQIS